MYYPIANLANLPTGSFVKSNVVWLSLFCFAYRTTSWESNGRF